MAASSQITLAPKYYLANFHKLLCHVEHLYADLLNHEESLWLARFRKLTNDAQCLLIRLMTRKGEWFRSDKLHYPELDSIDSCIAELVNQRFINDTVAVDITTLATALLTKAEILHLFPELPKNLRKPELLQTLAATNASLPLNLPFTAVQLLDNDKLALFCLLFFGNQHQEFAQFVLNDLGIHRFEHYEISASTRLFNSREDVDTAMALHILSEQYKNIDKTCETSLTQLSLHIPTTKGSYSSRLAGKLINAIGRDFERLNNFEQAIHLLKQTDLPPARERCVRMYMKQEHFHQAQSVIMAMIEKPKNVPEQEVAFRLASTVAKKLRTSPPKPVLFSIPERKLTLDLTTQRVELAVRDSLVNEGWQAFYLENHFLNTLFGLAFWDIIFAPVDGAFINPYQRQPLDLYRDSFKTKRQGMIDTRLAEIRQSGIWKFISLIEDKYGLQNPFIAWDLVDREWIELAVTTIPNHTLAALFDTMLIDLKAYRTGMPDLIAFKANKWFWCEVKGPGDRLQDNQKRWMRVFRELMLNYEVCYVESAL
ncbi:VRR-NUC domain-containing protein [Vibrio nomapromontoriensis]|uniref:VRR-NUC domain-containing protein n=1 Tax=Vibrio nomapromontoriensis TaxID=2910246 RepID=UPI003D0FA492